MRLADEENCYIGLLCDIDRFLKTGSRIIFDFAALRVKNLGLRRHLRLDSRQRRDGVFFLAVTGPPAKRCAPVVCKWTNDRDRSDVLIQRQRLALVLQQNHRTARDLTRKTNTFRTQQRIRLTCFVGVRSIKESEAKLDPQNSS